MDAMTLMTLVLMAVGLAVKVELSGRAEYKGCGVRVEGE